MDILTVIIVFAVYFAPTITAYNRWSVNSWLVFLLNLILWWTIIVWFLLFFMAIGKTKEDVRIQKDILKNLKK